MTTRNYNLQFNRGQGLLEAILAIAVFGAIAGVLITMAVGGFRGLEQGGEQTEADALAQQGMDAVHAVRDREWNRITCTTCIANDGGGTWDLISGASEGVLGTNGKFTRTITISDVCRDGTNAIAACGGSNYLDPHTKEVVVQVSWTTRGGVTNTVERRAYVSNWDSKDKVENTTADFGDGNFGTPANTAASTLGDGASVTLTPQS